MEQFALLCGSKICGGEIESPKANDVSDKIKSQYCKIYGVKQSSAWLSGPARRWNLWHMTYETL